MFIYTIDFDKLAYTENKNRIGSKVYLKRVYLILLWTPLYIISISFAAYLIHEVK